MLRGWLLTALEVVNGSRRAANLRNYAGWIRSRFDDSAREIWKSRFDPVGYWRLHPDVADRRMNPAAHFLLHGNAENRDPSPDFDTQDYLETYPDVKEAGVNALLHYALFGAKEGRMVDRSHPLRGPIGRTNHPHVGPLVSVVIPCFNYGAFVEQAIRSVLDQTLTNVEIIVVEGGSTDGSAEVVRDLESRGLPRTFFHYREGRHLPGDNRNYGIARARGRYICCLDADDMIRPVYLEVAVFLAEAFGYDFVYPSLESFGASREKWIVGAPSFPEILDENQVSTVALFRRDVWEKIGGFRDWGLGKDYVFEDWDFWIRMTGHGFAGRSIREPLMLYRVHPASMTAAAKPGKNAQSAKLRQANANLAGRRHFETEPLTVGAPYLNLPPLENDRPGFLVSIPFSTTGGAENLFLTIARSAAARGHRPIVITSRPEWKGVPEDDSGFTAITPHVYHLARLFHTTHHRREFVRYLIRRYNAETLLVFGSPFTYRMLPQLAEEFPRLRIVDHIFNGLADTHWFAAASATVVPSAKLRDQLIRDCGASPDRVVVIPHGVVIQPPHGPVAKLPEEAAGKFVVGCFGRLSAEKGPDVFVEIARKLARHSEFFFVMTGDGPESAAVMEAIRRYGLERKFFTPGFVADVAPVMRAADVVALPSRIDGMPLAVFEAQALEKPVVASEVGSLPSMIVDGETGFLCEPADIDGFCERLLLLARDPELRSRMGQAGRARVQQHFNAETMLERYHRLFAEPARATSS
jgi:O-antigen biosynthesis protein